MDASLYVVGLGASAGGLKSLTAFFKHVTDASGIAFIVVQHLNKDYTSRLDVILSRHTSLPVIRIQGGEKIAPNTIYVLPEGKKVFIKDSRLQLITRPAHEIKNTAINYFFHSLALDIKEKAIGVILSGTGSDGLEGAKAIEKYKGVVMVEDPGSAEFGGMPQNIILRDHPDHVLPAEALAEEIMHYVIDKEATGWADSGNK